jgi:signal transduction histidine kinase
MTDILIRNLDDTAIQNWKQAAKKRGTSLQAMLKEVLEAQAPKPLDQDFWNKLRHAREAAGPPSNIALDLIQEGRDHLDAKMERYLK